MGGSLIALWKKEGGVQHILIGNADQRLATKVLMASLQQTMAKHLLKAHPRVAQFSVHVEDGTTKAVHCVQSILPQYTDAGPGSEVDTHNPMVCLSVDGKNAFNAILRRAVFDAIAGIATREYDNGRVNVGDRIKCPEFVKAYIPCFESYYSKKTSLVYIDANGKQHIIGGETGVQQGDPPRGGLYAVGQHASLCRVANRHTDVYLVVFADNVFILGLLNAAL